MNEYEFVRQVFPEASADEASNLLWSCTAYPLCGAAHALEQLQEMRLKANSPDDAMRIGDGEMDQAWEEGRAAREGCEA